MAATPPKFRSFYPLELFGLIQKTARPRPVFCQKLVFTHRRVRINGASGTKLPFRCISLRRSTPAGPSGPKSQPARCARQLDKFTTFSYKTNCANINQTKVANYPTLEFAASAGWHKEAPTNPIATVARFNREDKMFHLLLSFHEQ